MNGLKASAGRARQDHGGRRQGLAGKADLMICPPATLIWRSPAGRAARRIAIGGQDCHAEPSGAFTGDISAEMLADAGASAVIVGHSERRTAAQGNRRRGPRQGQGRLARRADRDRLHRRDRAPSARPARRWTCWAASSTARCRRASTAANLVVAYEPVWAIGTGLTPTAADVAEAHAFIRKRARRAPWRGRRQRSASSMAARSKPSNAKELMACRQRRWRAGRRRQPESRGLSGHRRGLPLTREKSGLPPGWKCRGGSCRNRPEFPI